MNTPQIDPTEFEGRVALVTAAAGKGIGQAVCRRLAAGGAHIVVTDIHVKRTERVANALAEEFPKIKVLGLALDAGDRDAIDRVVEQATESMGPVHILINNAAINVQGQIWDYDPADWDRAVAVNLTGPWYLCRRIMPLMRQSGGGVVINMSSYAPDVGGGGVEAPYAITKGGVNAMTRGLAVEGGPHGIRHVTISMGVVEGTRFIDQNPQIAERLRPQTPLGKHATTEDIAELTAFLASDRAGHITGEIVNVAGGIYMRT